MASCFLLCVFSEGPLLSTSCPLQRHQSFRWERGIGPLARPPSTPTLNLKVGLTGSSPLGLPRYWEYRQFIRSSLLNARTVAVLHHAGVLVCTTNKPLKKKIYFFDFTCHQCCNDLYIFSLLSPKGDKIITWQA